MAISFFSSLLEISNQIFRQFCLLWNWIVVKLEKIVSSMNSVHDCVVNELMVKYLCDVPDDDDKNEDGDDDDGDDHRDDEVEVAGGVRHPPRCWHCIRHHCNSTHPTLGILLLPRFLTFSILYFYVIFHISYFIFLHQASL